MINSQLQDGIRLLLHHTFCVSDFKKLMRLNPLLFQHICVINEHGKEKYRV